MATRICTGCKQPKPFSAFWKGAGYKEGIRSQCKDCCLAASTRRRREKSKRKCGKCQKTKQTSAFSRSKNASSWCKQCCRESATKWRSENREQVLAGERERSKSPGRIQYIRDYSRAYRLFTKYGIDAETYDRLFIQQEGKCAICKRTPDKAPGKWGVLHVDHCHATGNVRGLLCYRCNSAVGGFGDDPSLMRAALTYLEKTSASNPAPAPTPGPTSGDRAGPAAR